MPDPFRTRADLTNALPHIAAAPKDSGPVEAIVIRPAKGERVFADRATLSFAHGVHGDHWEHGCWRSTEDGQPHPDVQICMMSTRAITAIGGARENWAPAGDNLFIDIDMTPENLPPGTHISLGTAELVITPEPHKACQGFIDRYGRDAAVFVNTGPGYALRMRGIYARVIVDGEMRVGDRLRKLG